MCWGDAQKVKCNVTFSAFYTSNISKLSSENFMKTLHLSKIITHLAQWEISHMLRVNVTPEQTTLLPSYQG